MAFSINPKIKTVALWTLKVVVGVLFASAGAAKLAGAPMMVQEFATIGLGQGFRYLTGVIEIASVVMLLMPKTSRLGALGLVAICVGALIAQLAVLHGDLIHVFVMLIAAAFLVWRGGKPATRSGLI